jgi:beta-glucosidase
VLTGKMAGAYIEGMQGDDPKYLRCASTLKHFYGNNTEVRPIVVKNGFS